MKKTALSFLMILLCVFCAWSIEYSIDNYAVKVVVGKNAVHSVNEDIAMNFHTPAHGFYRDIPYSFEGSPVHARITSVSCSSEYSTEYEDGMFSMKIGSSDKTVKGLQNYRIQYNYDLGIDTNTGYDEFYYDIIGSSWECRIDFVSYEIYLPKEGLNVNDIKAWVTSGRYGSSNELNAKLGVTDAYYVIYGTASSLKPGEAVTIRVQLPEGWYQGAREPWDYTHIFKALAPYLSIVLVLIAFILWAVYGKDRVPIITARFEPPEGFSPLIVGYLADGSVDDKDIISMIFNWADRGLLTINEPKKDKFTFTRLGDIELDAPKAEKDLFYAFFKGCAIDEAQTLSKLQESNFAEAMARVKLAVTRMFTKEKSLHSSKSRALAVLTGFATVLPLILFSAAVALNEYTEELFALGCILSVCFTLFGIISQWLLFRKWYIRKGNLFAFILSMIPFFIASGICYFASKNIVLSLCCCGSYFLLSMFTVITDKKSEYGQHIFEEVLGYREFIDKVSMDELRMMIDKDPEIYYRVLSYAVVMGLEEKWSKKFDGIAVAPPTWYVGSNVVDAMYYSSLARRMKTVIALNSIPQGSGRGVGGTGFNSHGFAGGGFGGGGGHAW